MGRDAIKIMTEVIPKFSPLNIIKAIYYKPTADIILNDKSLKTFPHIRNKTEMLTVINPIPHCTVGSSQKKQTRKEIKGILKKADGQQIFLTERMEKDVVKSLIYFPY